jgi:hypothetical protein
MAAGARHIAWVMILAGGLLYGLSRAFAPGGHLRASVWETGPSPQILQSILAGPERGLMADMDVVSVFSLYDDIHHHRLTNKQQLMRWWGYLASYLERAQAMDPRFQDTYALAGGLLGYTYGFQDRAVDILERGAKANPKNWRYPFTAGFLAHDQLHDDARAHRLLMMAIRRPGVPPEVVGVAANLLAKDKGLAASIQFLEIMEKMMPPFYRGPIQTRIKRIKKRYGSGSGAQTGADGNKP